jgi:hypothetical protein
MSEKGQLETGMTKLKKRHTAIELNNFSVRHIFLAIMAFVWAGLSVHYWTVLGGAFNNSSWYMPEYVYTVVILESWFLVCVLVLTYLMVKLGESISL